MATPLLTATPGTPPTYNPSMAETFSWIPVEGAGRPLFAQATYLANPEDIKVSLSADNINVSLDELELNTDQIEELITTTNASVTALSNNLVSFNSQLTSQVSTINQNTSATNTTLVNIDTDLDTTNSRLQTLINQTNGLEGSVDGIEGLIGTTNTRLQTLIDQTDGIEGSIDQIEPKLDTIITTLSNVPITQTATPTLTSSLLITGQKRIYSIFGVSTSTNSQYIHIYNSSTSTPAGTPVAVFSIPANSNFSFDINKGLNFTSGCLVTNSLTLTSFSGGMDDLYFTVVHTG